MVTDLLCFGLFLLHDVVDQLDIHGLFLLQKILVDLDIGIVDPLEVFFLGENVIKSVTDNLS